MRLVSDANIWIHLDHGGLLQTAFSLSAQFTTPDVVVAELGGDLGGRVVRLGLAVVRTEPGLEAAWRRLRHVYPAPSDADLWALLHASRSGARLLTGDRHLRCVAEAESVDVSGLLWLLDEMVSTGCLRSNVAAQSLQAMLDRGARLPPDECERRFLTWMSGQG